MSSYLRRAPRRAAVRSRSSAGRATSEPSQSGGGRRRRCCAVTAARRSARHPAAPGRKGRFHAPYLRDDLLGRGVMVETLETATTWSNLQRLYAAVRDALGEHAPLVACHISHLYPSGASLYFTFLAPPGCRRSDRPVAAREDRRLRGDRRRRRHDHPSPRDRSRPPRVPGRGGQRGRRRGAEGRQAGARPGRDHEPRQAGVTRSRLRRSSSSPAPAAASAERSRCGTPPPARGSRCSHAASGGLEETLASVRGAGADGLAVCADVTESEAVAGR